MTKPLTDDELAAKYGRYASFNADPDPPITDNYGDPHEEERERLLARLITPAANVLDLGCGAGQRTCDLAGRCSEMWGFDGNVELLDGARRHAEEAGLTNIRFVQGDTSEQAAVDQLPDDHFDLIYSIRGPFVIPSLMPKLGQNGLVMIELYQDPLGLKEIFGRRPFLPTNSYADGDWCIAHHKNLGMVPASVKHYYFDTYYRDVDQLAGSLGGMALSNWWMDYRPYDPEKDKPALELYARYNRTDRGIRVTSHRRLYLLRRAPIEYYPADGMASEA